MPKRPDLTALTDRDRQRLLTSVHRSWSSCGLVVPLLERCWPSVLAVSKTLLRGDEVGHKDVCNALKLTDDGGPGSFDLSLIRSGCATSTFTTMRVS